MIPPQRRDTVRQFELFIDGRWVDAPEHRPLTSPWDGRPIATIGFGGPDDLEAAIQAGVRAETTMRALPAAERKEILRRICDGITEHAEDLATTIRDEAGKPIRFARAEVRRARETFRAAVDEAGRLAEASIDLGAVEGGVGRFGIVRKVPVGLIAAVSPFNFPLNLVAHKVAPAIAAGCPVVLKPASQTPIAALRLAELCHAAGLPPGGLNVLPCSRATAGPFTTDPRFKVLTFTGSPAVGWDMKNRAGKKKVVLELGGDAAAIVHHDADLDAVVPRVAFGAFAYAGQVCISVQRALVHDSLYDSFRDRFVAHVEEHLVARDPADEATVCGPVIDAANLSRIEAWIEDAVAKGATLLTGGVRTGSCLSPAVLEGVPPDALLATREAFGPVVCIERYATLDAMVERVNASRFGLQAGIFTDSVRDVWACYERLEVAGLIHNDVPTFRVDHMPYGGVKDSGFGREGVKWAIDDYTELRLLALNPGGPPR